MIVSHVLESMNSLILFFIIIDIIYILYWKIIWNLLCFNLKLEMTEIFEHKTLTLTCILQSRQISWWAAIYIHDEYDDNLFTNDERSALRSTYNMYLKNDNVIEYGFYNNYKEEDLGRKKRESVLLQKEEHMKWFLWNISNFIEIYWIHI